MVRKSFHYFHPVLLIPVLLLLSVTVISSCGTDSDHYSPVTEKGIPETTEQKAFAIALHGGAGVISKDIDPETRDGYLNALDHALRIGYELLDAGGTSLDAVEAVVRYLEDDERFNAGKGAVFTSEERHELDASIMDGRDLNAGAVAGIRTVKNPITMARKIMEESRHVLLSGDGAENFASLMDLERVDNSYFNTERRREQLHRAQERASAGNSGTVGVAALDRHGNLAAGTSTGGMTNKMPGRIGDSPLIGAGTYADNNSCAVSATGHGEKFIRNAVAYQICAIMEYTGVSLQEAAEQVIFGKLDEGDGGIIAVDRYGRIAMVFSSPGMFRGAADSEGRFEVAIW